MVDKARGKSSSRKKPEQKTPTGNGSAKKKTKRFAKFLNIKMGGARVKVRKNKK